MTGSASAESVKGKIENFEYLQNPVWAEAKDPKRRGYSFREIVPTVPAKYRRLFPHIPKEICIAALSKEKQKPEKPILVRVGGGRSTPVTIVVPPGTKLIFKNTDPFKHRLYGVKLPQFSANDTLKGATREWTVPKAGVFEIRDELAPSLRMWVVGDPNVAGIAYPSMSGEFRLKVPTSGEYEIQPFFAGKKVGPAEVVELDGRDVTIKKAIKVAKDPPKKPAKDDKEDDKEEKEKK
jgi:hypothetical protein